MKWEAANQRHVFRFANMVLTIQKKKKKKLDQNHEQFVSTEYSFAVLSCLKKDLLKATILSRKTTRPAAIGKSWLEMMFVHYWFPKTTACVCFSISLLNVCDYMMCSLITYWLTLECQNLTIKSLKFVQTITASNYIFQESVFPSRMRAKNVTQFLVC